MVSETVRLNLLIAEKRSEEKCGAAREENVFTSHPKPFDARCFRVSNRVSVRVLQHPIQTISLPPKANLLSPHNAVKRDKDNGHLSSLTEEKTHQEHCGRSYLFIQSVQQSGEDGQHQKAAL